jgi:hypothetical protein
VTFIVSDFTSEELDKMQKFGIPVITMMRTNLARGRQTFQTAITQINATLVASFPTEEEAKRYEEEVINQIRTSMAAVRQRNDDFTSSETVNI